MRRIVWWVLNLFDQELALVLVGVLMECLYRAAGHAGLLEKGLEFFPLAAGLLGAGLTFAWRLPRLIRALTQWRAQHPGRPGQRADE